MAKIKKPPLHKRILHVFFPQNREIRDLGNVREVYFGIRIRVLGLLAVVMIAVVGIFSFVMYFSTRRLVEEEKNAKARSLTGILAVPAEFYLDRNADTTPDQIQTKYQIIQREAQSFLAYNADVVKIILTDEYGVTRFSTAQWDYRRRVPPPYIKEGLQLKDDVLASYDYTEKVADGKRRWREMNYRAVVSPIVLKKGMAVDILNDFKKYYSAYRSANRFRRQQIYAYLWQRYRSILSPDFDPTAVSRNKQKDVNAPLVEKRHDIDFLFHALLKHCITARNKRIPPAERWLWDDRWLLAAKEKKGTSLREEDLTKAKEFDDLIVSRLTDLSKKVDDSRKLGALAVVFNVDAFRKVPEERIAMILKVAGIMIAVGCAAVLFVLNYRIKNLKKLERWAIAVSKGNLDEKIVISSNEEIGRLGDIMNYMLDEIKMKYHLEKFVSRSTKSMISGTRASNGGPDLGVTGRRDLAFMFSDVRGFTSFSEKNNPETVIEVLNFYLELQSNIVKRHKGDIDDFVGDQIMAHFAGETRADRAIATAIEIMKIVTRENAERRKKGMPVFDLGIGLHRGEVVVGNVGSRFRMDFACVGDAVNLASRLCSIAGPGEILASRDLFDSAKKQYPHKEMTPVEVKGKENKIPLVRVEYRSAG